MWLALLVACADEISDPLVVGEPVAVPAGCTAHRGDALVGGREVTILRCGDESSLSWSEVGGDAPLGDTNCTFAGEPARCSHRDPLLIIAGRVRGVTISATCASKDGAPGISTACATLVGR